MNLVDKRLDPSLLNGEELKNIASLAALTQRQSSGSLKAVDGTEIPLPGPVYRLLADVISGLQHGDAMMLMPLDETFTTQAAADYLGVSRQYFVNLLEEGKIPFHKVGTHRRIVFKDLLEFETKRDAERRAGLDALFDRIREDGFYDSSYTGR